MTHHVHHVPLIFMYLFQIEYDMKSKYPEEYSSIDKVGSEKLLARKSCFV